MRYKSFKRIVKLLIIFLTIDILGTAIHLSSHWINLPPPFHFIEIGRIICLVIEYWAYGISNAIINKAIRSFFGCRPDREEHQERPAYRQGQEEHHERPDCLQDQGEQQLPGCYQNQDEHRGRPSCRQDPKEHRERPGDPVPAQLRLAESAENSGALRAESVVALKAFCTSPDVDHLQQNRQEITRERSNNPLQLQPRHNEPLVLEDMEDNETCDGSRVTILRASKSFHLDLRQNRVGLGDDSNRLPARCPTEPPTLEDAEDNEKCGRARVKRSNT